uniref:Clamp loader subunit n=1 Tax=Pseudomonas phage Cygsa01 TaxID=3138529 RepID=A0AAU6W4K4_9VIRU
MSEEVKVGLFDWLGALNTTKADLLNEASEKSYDPFIIRRGIAQNMDTVLLAQEMNKLHALPKRMQHDFFLRAITKKKRYGKWSKKESVLEKTQTISTFYNVSLREAQEYANLLTDDQVKELVERMDTGGRKK